jgi:hypothetical protein
MKCSVRRGNFSMDRVAIVLEILLGLFFLLSVFLAARLREIGWHEIFLTMARTFADCGMLWTAQKLREKCFGVALQGSPAAYEEYPLRSGCGRIEVPLSHSPIGEKDMMMKTSLGTKEQKAIRVETEVIEADVERLTESGFTSEEIVSLLWLREWYQKGGSDRVTVVRHWEFLKLLVLSGKLDP